MHIKGIICLCEHNLFNLIQIIQMKEKGYKDAILIFVKISNLLLKNIPIY